MADSGLNVSKSRKGPAIRAELGAKNRELRKGVKVWIEPQVTESASSQIEWPLDQASVKDGPMQTLAISHLRQPGEKPKFMSSYPGQCLSWDDLKLSQFIEVFKA